MTSIDWKPIDQDTPRDGRDVLLLAHGRVIHGWYAPGEWHDYFEGREYDGPAWVCFDDAVRFEIEETPDGEMHGPVTHWAEMPELPVIE